jgi:succinate dehydrogenase/fumarate reductase flavoprotein subunit
MGHVELVASYQEPDTVTRAGLFDARADPRPHPAGKPVSRSTYVTHGCRCDGCRAKNAEHAREWRGTSRRPRRHPTVARLRQAEVVNRDNAARYRARAILAGRHNVEYRALLAEQRAAVNTERGPLPGDG